jgi:hypothetical protein
MPLYRAKVFDIGQVEWDRKIPGVNRLDPYYWETPKSNIKILKDDQNDNIDDSCCRA